MEPEFQVSGGNGVSFVFSFQSGCGCGLVAQSCPTLATPWAVACQAPLSMRFLRQEDWSGLPFASPVDLSHPGIRPGRVSQIAGRFFTD